MELAVKDIEVTLDGNNILKGVTSELQGNEFVGLIGPNGSGKSTLLKTIYRVIKPQCGVITLNDKNINKIPLKESAQSIGVVSQFSNFNFDFTVEEIVMMGRAPHKKTLELDKVEDYEIVYDMLKKVHMENYAERNFSTLSGGERQRILLARALAQNPKILILDEPTNHLDIKYQIELLDLLKSLNLQIFAALHDLNLAAVYCDRVYVMKDGLIIAEGKPREVFTKELIKEVFEVDVEIFQHPITNQLNIMYFSQKTFS